MIEKNYRISGNINLTVAHISDLHNNNRNGRQVIESLNRKQPDIIALTGDIVLRRYPIGNTLLVQSEKHVLPFLTECAKIAPTYMSLGNHEMILCEEDIELIVQTGVELLDNRYVKCEKYAIGGLTSAYVSRYRRAVEEMDSPKARTYYPMPRPFVRPIMQSEDYAWLYKFEQIPRYRILLCHHPEYWCLEEPILTNRKIDLVLSGHAHGGQFRLFGQGIFSPGQGWFPEYTSGIHKGENGRMIVSKGLANTAHMVPRLFNPTEIVYIEIVR